MRTIFTTEDLKNFIEQVFNGNLRKSLLSNGQIVYDNENSEEIIMINDDDGETTTIDLAKYLNITFYSWKERLLEKSNVGIDANPQLSNFENWVQSLNFSMNEAYALVEKIDEEIVTSQDIDSSTISARVTFLMQADKIKNLDYYVTKIRNNFVGVPQEIQNSYGEMLTAYFLMGDLLFEQEPMMTQLGECIVCTANVQLSYMAQAMGWMDNKIYLSFDGDDTYDENGDIVGETKYMEMPLTEATWQAVFTSNTLPTAERPDITGIVTTAISNIKTISFFDFKNKQLTMRLNDIFWSLGAIRKNGLLTSVEDVNIPVFVKVTSNGNSYVYKDVIERMEKHIVNSDFNISSITLKNWGKII